MVTNGHGDDKVGQGKGHGECRSEDSLPIKQDGQFSLREKPSVSGEKHSRQREQHVQRPWGGSGPGVLRRSGKGKNWGLEMKQGPDQTWVSPLSEMGRRSRFERREIVEIRSLRA